MSYKEWFLDHGEKQQAIVKKLIGMKFSKSEIIDYFDFENMRENEKNFCPLYEKNQKCHDMKHLNCLLCACPYFRFSDEGIGVENEIKIFSSCSKGLGEKFHSTLGIHHDCSHCKVPHTKKFATDSFGVEGWFTVMENCEIIVK